MSGYASPLELTWSVVAVLGLLFSLGLAYDGWIDYRAVMAAIRDVPPRARAWGPRWWVAVSSFVANSCLSLVYLGFIVIGFIAMQFPPPPPTTEQAISNMWAGWVLIAMEVLLASVQAWHLFVRFKINHTGATGP